MLKNIFISWIIFQLLIIGYVRWSIINDIANDKYECTSFQQDKDYLKWKESAVILISILIPLNYFIDNNIHKDISLYCNKK